MTTNTLKNLYGRYLEWEQSNPVKELEELTIEDMIRVHEDEVETAHDLEIERQIDYALIEQENN